MSCLPNDHLVAEAIELREGKMISNHLHDFKNSGFIDILAKIIKNLEKTNIVSDNHISAHICCSHWVNMD